MPSDTKTAIKIKIDVERGPTSLAQKAAWSKFWRKIIAEGKASER